ncbi:MULTISPECIES: methyl-accepting chemotaxis protein [Methylotenera]|uniref:methyl-accepting chemotaxis protein n=1 Tax=Methylotenera TaxID=359407 RepID=UPI00035D14C0|nr:MULTISPECIES: methyl-accepting chemotaxis protein [Methylotenera]
MKNLGLRRLGQLLQGKYFQQLENEVAESTAIKKAIDKARCVAEYDLEGRILSVNNNFLNALGFEEREVVGQLHARFLEPNQNDRDLWDKFALGQNDTGEYKFVAKNGEVHWFQGYYSPIPNNNGSYVKVTSYMTDVTKSKLQSAENQGLISAISKAQGVIEFTLDGRIVTANQNFLNVVGYTLNEIKGQHHSLFVDSAYKNSPEYRSFWEKLARGEYDAGQYQRVGKNGNQIWLQASYNPILDFNGKPFKVVKYATDISTQKNLETLIRGQLSAIGQSLGVISFTPDGHVTEVNQNFLDCLGYSEVEAIGQHHSLFVDPAYRTSSEYSDFWAKLNRGEYDKGVYKRFGKGGKEIWIQASYNPIKDVNGKVTQVVKFASDITAEKNKAVDASGQLDAINNHQAVIEFTPDGKVIRVNAIFLDVMGYTESEAIGQHHSTFVDPTYKASTEYHAFWEKLGRGEFDSGQYQCFAKGGREVWLQASYNPILDVNGKVSKVVKFATEITSTVQAQQALIKAVGETQAVVGAAKAGDLTQRITTSDKTGNIAELCTGINSLIDNMGEIISQIKQAGDTINTAAKEIAQGNADLSQRTEEQASSLEETASSMEQLASTVKQNAENAKQANQLATTASTVAIKGGSVVGEVVNTMTDISASSGKIVEIISVIDSIAFQTNILALNAAVEAARAGEQGRGFAVVAGEVRNLAQRSAAAAKEIKQLISDSVEKVKGGTKLVEAAGHTMEEIVSSVKRVTDIMGEIAAASIEQSSGIDQVNIAITQMDEVTQQNAALVEEATAAAESLVDQANSLMEAVSIFKVDERAVTSKSVSSSSARTVVTPISRAPVKQLARPKPQSVKMNGTQHLAKVIPANGVDGDWTEF